MAWEWEKTPDDRNQFGCYHREETPIYLQHVGWLDWLRHLVASGSTEMKFQTKLEGFHGQPCCRPQVYKRFGSRPTVLERKSKFYVYLPSIDKLQRLRSSCEDAAISADDKLVFCLDAGTLRVVSLAVSTAPTLSLLEKCCRFIASRKRDFIFRWVPNELKLEILRLRQNQHISTIQ